MYSNCKGGFRFPQKVIVKWHWSEFQRLWSTDPTPYSCLRGTIFDGKVAVRSWGKRFLKGQVNLKYSFLFDVDTCICQLFYSFISYHYYSFAKYIVFTIWVYNCSWIGVMEYWIIVILHWSDLIICSRNIHLNSMIINLHTPLLPAIS